MKIEQDKEIKVEVIEVDEINCEVIVKILDGKNKGVTFSIELFLAEGETSHDVEVGDIAFVKLRMAN